MPIPVISSISSKPVIITSTGGTTASISGSSIVVPVISVKKFAMQILGFIPLTDCSFSECRTFVGSCYINPVFGSSNVNLSSYENDISTFFISDTLKRITVFTLEKKDERLNVWNDVVNIASTNPLLFPFTSGYGTFYNFNYFSAHKEYIGFQINWGHVISLQGAGDYRLKIYSPASILGRTFPYPYCMVSEQFRARPFDCYAADHTVKFEAYQSGRIGSITQAGFIFDLCNIKIFDSIRVKGFFGFETTEYDEILEEFQSGLMDRVRDEAIQQHDYIGLPMPKYIHDRLKTYGLMSDSLYVSDYNIRNADYNIKQKSVIKASGYKPKYYKGTRLSSVKAQFKDGIQSVIKSSSCQTLR